MATHKFLTSATLGVLLATAACQSKQPGGQVVATVDGKEVTLQELNTELQASNVPGNVDRQTAQRVLLQRVVERKLIDGLATQKGLDKSPDYLAQQRRLDELLLAQTYAKQQLAAVPLPTDRDISTFMGSNPGSFSERQQLLLDQIRFPTPANMATLKGLEATHSLDAVAAFLTARNIKFDRSGTGLDSAGLPPALLAQINALPAGEPFVIPTGGMFTINVLTGRKPIPNDPGQARAAATQAWRQQKVQQLLASQLATARSAAKISYQKGFEPPAPTPAKPGAPAAPAQP